MSDRQVHARLANGDEVVRYDRSGKWYLERANVPRPQRGWRQALRLVDAVAYAAAPGTARYWHRPGGQAFDAKLLRHLSAGQPKEPCHD